jgi:pimeloyl-ACP methyl ester carboxylesterase
VSAPAAAGSGNRPTIVFLHGIGGGAAGFAPHLRLCEAHGWPAFAWNQPGYGGTPLVEPYTLEAAAAALLAELDARSIGQCVPVGHSMGGMVALELLALAPQRVAAAVLAHTSPAFGGADGEFQRKFIEMRTRPLDEGATMADVAAKLVPTMLGPGAQPGAADAARSVMSAVPPDTYRKAVAALTRFDRRALLPSIRVPVLCLAAEVDRTAAPEVLEKMSTRIPGARYACLPGLGHLAPVEDPQAFCNAVFTFLGSLE